MARNIYDDLNDAYHIGRDLTFGSKAGYNDAVERGIRLTDKYGGYVWNAGKKVMGYTHKKAGEHANYIAGKLTKPKSIGQKQYDRATTQSSKNPPPKKRGKEPPRKPQPEKMRGRKTNFTEDKWQKTGKKRRRFRRRRRSMYPLVWKVLNAMQDKNTLRRINSGRVTWAMGSAAIYTSRLFKHVYNPTGQAAGPPQVSTMDFNGFLENYKYQTYNVPAGTGDNQLSVSADFHQFNPITDPEVKMFVKAKMVHTLKNNNILGVFMNVYVWKAKLDIPANSADATEGQSDYLPDVLWQNYLDSAQTTNSNATSTNTALNFQVAYLSDARQMIKQYWKKVSQEHVQLAVGEIYQKVIKHKKRIINLSVLKQRHLNAFKWTASTAVAAQDGAYMFKGEYLIQIYFHGQIVHDHATPFGVNYQGATGTNATNPYSIDYTQRLEIVGNALPLVGKKYYHYINDMPAIVNVDASEQAITSVTNKA